MAMRALTFGALLAAIPVCRGPTRLPVGVTLVGPRLTDARLLAIAKAVAPVIDTDPAARLRALWT